ncbi:MAG: hypothetical protein AABY04_03130 [Candidatus Micrarchaeota archaeon]
MTDNSEMMPPVQMSSVLADTKQPFLKMSTRWDYIARYLDIWKEMIKFRGYAVISFIAGIYLIFTFTIAGVVALGAATYFWELHKFRLHRLESQRSVMIGH